MDNNKNLKLKERCEILEKIVISIANIYSLKDTTKDQKKFIETILGAAIWYLPHNKKYWTGRISNQALEALINDNRISLTKEHQFPRKIAAKELLSKSESLLGKKISLQKLYEEKFAKYNLVTPQENKKISRFQRDDVFIDEETAYAQAGINLIEINNDLLAGYRNGIL